MTRRIRVFLLLALMLVGSFSLFAQPDHEIFYEFYSDKTLTELVGERWITCFGIYSWGIQTPYRLVFQGDDC